MQPVTCQTGDANISPVGPAVRIAGKAQGRELLLMLDAEQHPVIVMADAKSLGR